MFLSSFAVLLTAGFGLWLLGHTFDFKGVAVIGAVLVIAVGGAVTLTDLSVRTGETVDKEYTTVDGNTVVDNTSTSYQYEPVAPSEQFGGLGTFSIGALVMIVGALLIRSIGEV